MSCMQRTKGASGEREAADMAEPAEHLLPTHIDGYCVTNDGRVYSRKTNKWLKPATTPAGYLVYGLQNGGACRVHFAHRLVAAAFISAKPNKHVINHKNGIKTDNRVENLEWVTSAANNKHAYDTGLKKAPRGIEHKSAKLNDELVREIRAQAHLPKKPLARKYGINIKTMYQIIQNKTWRHVT